MGRTELAGLQARYSCAYRACSGFRGAWPFDFELISRSDADLSKPRLTAAKAIGVPIRCRNVAECRPSTAGRSTAARTKSVCLAGLPGKIYAQAQALVAAHLLASMSAVIDLKCLA